MFVCFFSDGTQKAASHQEMRAETGGQKVSTVRLRGVPLGQRQEGRMWEDLPESERCGVERGRDRQRGGWRAQAVLWCVLLPAS